MQKELESTLAKLVSIPSVSSNSEACFEAISYVRSQIESLGLYITSSDTPAPWLIATTQDTKEPDVLLISHLDVVPGDNNLFTMQSHDGKLYGRGVYDMKLATACYLEFFKKHANILGTLNIGMLFTTDEELGGDSVVTLLKDGWRPKATFIPDGGDNWLIEARAKGLYGVEMTAHGKTAHGSRPWEGKNAVHTLLDVVAALRTSFPFSTNPADATLNVTTIEGGAVINQIPDHATVRIDFRSFSKDELAVYRNQLTHLAAQYDLAIKVNQEGLPLIFDKTSPAVQTFLETLRETLGTDELGYRDSFGGSDGRHFAKYDIPCIIIEPFGGGRHGPDEWLLQKDLLKYYEMIETWLLR
jgi:acetylornithine deacetylase/succinyl-diaminopimelate desuccinylase-like protein